MRSLRLNASWMLFGRIGYAAGQLAMMLMMAKSGPDVLGTYALGLAITGPVFAFLNMNLRVILATDAKDATPLGVYTGLRVIGLVLSGVVIAAILAITPYSVEIEWVAALLGLSKAVESVDNLFYGLFMKHERMEYVAWSLLLRGPAMVPAFAVALYTAGLPAAVGAMVVWWVGVLLLHDLVRAASLESAAALVPRFDRGPLEVLARDGVTQGLAVSLLSLVQNAPRFVIEYFLGVAAVGVYAGIAYLIQVGQVVVIALGHAVMPRLSTYWADRDLPAFGVLAGKMVAINVGLGIAGVAVAAVGGRPLLTFAFSAEYAAHVDLFIVIMVAGGIEYIAWFSTNVLNAMRMFRVQVPMSLLVVVTVTAGSVALVPTMGVVGAAWAWIGSGFVHLVVAGSLIAWGVRRARS